MIIILIIWFIMSLLWSTVYMIDDGATDLVSWLSMILFIFLPPIYILIQLCLIIYRHKEKKRIQALQKQSYNDDGE